MTLRTDQQIDSSAPCKMKRKSGRVASSAGGHLRAVRAVHEPEETDIVGCLMTVANSARILELHYWSMEPGALEFLRAFVALPLEVQTDLRTFLETSPNLLLIRGTLQNGKITLFSPP